MSHTLRCRSLNRLAPLCFLLLLALPGAAPAQETQDTTKLPTALRSARNGLYTALVAMDAAKSSPFFADTAVVLFGGETFRGRTDIHTWLAGQFQVLKGVRFTGSTFNIADTQVTERAGYTVATPDAGEQSGTNEMIWSKQSDGSWKVVRLTIS